MAVTQVELAISVALFFIFFVIIINFLINFFTNFTGLTTTSELRTDAFNLYNTLFAGNGIPSNWNYLGVTPARVGLADNLYMAPFLVSDLNGTARNNYTINFTMSFDPNCLNTTWETTIRVYNASQNLFAYTLYNKTYCVSSYLKQADFAINVTVPASSSRMFFIYYSPDRNITNSNYPTTSFPPFDGNYSVKIYPTQTFVQVSYSRLIALRNLVYNYLRLTLGSGINFQIQVFNQ